MSSFIGWGKESLPKEAFRSMKETLKVFPFFVGHQSGGVKYNLLCKNYIDKCKRMTVRATCSVPFTGTPIWNNQKDVYLGINHPNNSFAD